MSFEVKTGRKKGVEVKKNEIRVFVEFGEDRKSWAWVPKAPVFPSTVKAIQWIRSNGQVGETYRVMHVKTEDIQIQEVTKRALVLAVEKAKEKGEVRKDDRTGS